jgi:hypothetical protein
MRRLGVAFVVLALGRAAQAEDIVYVEALGKAGAYGIGYEHVMTERLSFGIAASYMSVSGQQLYTAAPYLHATLLGKARHAMFGEIGGVLAHSRIPSPVEDWDGMTDTGSGGFLSAGYEYRRDYFIARASGAVVAGEGGLGGMIGLAVGVKR